MKAFQEVSFSTADLSNGADFLGEHNGSIGFCVGIVVLLP